MHYDQIFSQTLNTIKILEQAIQSLDKQKRPKVP